MQARRPSDKIAISLTNLPPSSAQRRFALIVVVLQFVACAVIAPIPATVPRIDGFIPFILAIIFVADLITAVLLFSQASFSASRALLILANGYLFSAFIVIPHALTFPGAFAPNGLFGGGIQSSGWINVFWHFGFIVAVGAYACLKDRDRRDTTIPTSAFYLSLAIQISLVCALTWAATTGESFFPRLFSDDRTYVPLTHYVAGLQVLTAMVVLLLIWARRSSALDLWLMVAVCMLISEMGLVAFGVTARFYIGWYVSRALGVAVSVVVLIALLSESLRLQSAVSRANIVLRRERNNRLINIKAATSSIVHEVRQPLAAMTTAATAARHWLEKASPDLSEIKSLFGIIERSGFRANEVLSHVPKLFEDADREEEPIDMNSLATETLKILSGELNNHGIKTNVELTSELPAIMGHRIQLQEVILNLVHNAIDAMDSIHVGRRSLTVRTKPDGGNAIVVEVQDSGPGIEKRQLAAIFDPFVTTKPKGTGLGLPICSRIIERHGGQLKASPDCNHGALFQIFLPIETANKPARMS